MDFSGLSLVDLKKKYLEAESLARHFNNGWITIGCNWFQEAKQRKEANDLLDALTKEYLRRGIDLS